MGLQVQEVTADADFREIIEVEWAAYDQPVCRLRPLYFPVLGKGENARAAAVEESTERQLAWHKSDPTSHWIKVIDDATRKAVGAACWHIYESNSYATESDEECTWWPEGEDREMANSLMAQWLTPCMKYMAKPHILLDICFVHPDFRRRGAGRMLVDWGLEKADSKGFETYIDATEDGIPLYEACDYVRIDEVEFSAPKPDPSQRWRELQNVLLPFRWWPMWRPAGGHTEPGTTTKPWASAK